MLRRITIVLMTVVCMVCDAQTTVSSYKYWMDSKFSEAKTGTATGTELSFDADISGQNEGVHFFYVMLQDSDGKLGKLHRFMYYIPGSHTEEQGSKVVSMEYWMDGDFASRKTESTDKSTIPLSIDIGSLNYGIHTMSYRVINDIGQYGPMKTFTYYITQTETLGSSVASVDYWIDGGYDSRSTMTPTGKDITLSDIDISSLSEGVHFFYVQPKDDLGRLGKLHRYMFFVPMTVADVVEGTKVTNVEYWIDSNYNGRQDIATNETTVPIEVDIKDLSSGQHTFSYRIKNDLGEYSDIRKKSFFIGQTAEEMSLGGYEYWIDDNYESRNIGTATGASEEINISDIDVSSLSEGVHFFYVRTQNSNDQYGKLHRFMFYIPMSVEAESAATLSQMEYWIDGDWANKTTLTAAAASPISIDVSEMRYGLHTFSYRTIDSNGNWGPQVNKNFYVNDKDYSVVYPLTAYRYFISDRKGEEQITPVTQFSDDIEVSIPNSKAVPVDLKTCQFEINSPEDGKMTMKRDVTYQFALQFQNSNGEWNAPTGYTHVQPETVTYDMAQLDVNGAYTVKKPAAGDIVAVKIEVSEPGTYYVHSAQRCSMGIYDAEGKIKYSVLPSEMKAGYGDYFEAGTYYGVVYNAVKDGSNPEENITMRFSDSSVKIAELMQRVENNVMYLTCATEGVVIYYTMDGSTPTTESTVYTNEGIQLSENCRVQAIAVKEGMLSSDILSFSYEDFTVATPVIEVENLKIKITTATDGAAIYYTLDESDPITNGYRYTSPIPFNENITVMAVAKKDNFKTSEVEKAEFVKNEYTCQKPMLTKDGNVLRVRTATENATIYYTLDGRDPTVESIVYDNEKGIVLTENCMVKAIAVNEATLFNSDIAVYEVDTFQVAAPVIKIENRKIVIESATEGATIYYLLSSTTPTLDNSLKYTEPIEWNGSTYVSAFAVKDNFKDSKPVRSYFAVNDYKCKNPVFTRNENNLTISTNTEGATIYYTLDGSDPLTAGNVYTEAGITLTQNCLVKAIAVNEATLFNSDISTIDITHFNVAEPVIALDGLKVVLTCATEGSSIYYTTDNTTPSKTKSSVYTGPIEWSSDTYVTAIGVKDNFNDSKSVRRYFRVNDYKCKKPVFKRNANNLTISTETEGTTIYYTLDDSDPLTAGSEYPKEGLTLTENCIVKAVAVNKATLFDSDISSIEITDFKVADPVITLDGIKVVLTCATEGASIYYTTDNTTPSKTNGELYTEPIAWSDIFRITAIAVKDNFKNSTTTTKTFYSSYYQCSVPEFRLDGNTMYITSKTEGATIHYTLDGSDPTTSSTVYTKAGVTLTQNGVIKAIAAKNGKMFSSEISSRDVTHFYVAEPTFRVVKKKIELLCATEGSKVYYTTDGSIEYGAGIPYTEPISWTENFTLYTYATKENLNNSGAVRYDFNIAEYSCGRPMITRDGDKLIVTTSTEGASLYYTIDGSTPTVKSTPYPAGGIPCEFNCTVKAIAIKDGELFDSQVASYEVNGFTVAEPTFRVVNKKIELQCTTEGSKIYYTTDGSVEYGAGILYSDPITWTEDFTLYAYATKDKFNSSGAIGYVFKVSDFSCGKPVITKEGDKLTVKTSTEGAALYYTTDGSTPTSTSTLYPADGIPCEFNCTVKVIAIKDGELFDSEVASYELTGFTVADPTFRVVNKKIELLCATEGAKIYYTIDGSYIEDGAGILYSGPITWNENFMLRAYAKKEKFNNSSVIDNWFYVSEYSCGTPMITKDGDKLIVTTSTEGASLYYTTDGSTPTSMSTPYPADGIPCEFNCTVKVIAIKDCELFDSQVASYEVNGFTVAEPVISLDGIKVVLTCATEGARIYYTTDGTNPSKTNGKLYAGPIAWSGVLDIYAVAVKDNFNDSPMAWNSFYSYSYQCGTPSFSREGNTMYITSNTEGATIHYTLDGSDPTTSSPVYTEAGVALTQNGTLKAITIMEGQLFNSEVASYTIGDIKAETPVIKFDEATKQVTITCATPDANIFYTIGGETPSATSMEYDGALTISNNKVIKAIAIAEPNYISSSVASYKPTYFACAPVTVEYDGRSVKFKCSTAGVSIYYATNGDTPSTDANLYDGKAVMLDGISTVKAIGVKADLKNSAVTFEPTAYYNGGKTYVTKAGDLEKAYAWCGKEKVEDITIEGNVNTADLATIRAMKAARHLDLSEAVVDGAKLPEKAFEGMDLISFISPKGIIETGDSLIKDAKSIGAVVWNSDIAVPENLTGDFTPVNALLYVNTDDQKNDKFRNVVVNGVAGNIVLSDAEDASNFYCPIEFTADKISYRHTYTLPTEKDVLTGWEALALPFTPTSISHSVNKECVPFKMYDPSSDKKPFWLCEMTSVGFAPADKIQANKGYIVCMPNNEDYSDEYILGGNGDITYMAENATVPVTANAYNNPDTYGEYVFRPNYMHLAQNDTVMVLNKTDYGSNKPGSVFVPNLRNAYPFESYVTKTESSSANASPLRIDAGQVGIMEMLYGLEDANKTVYSEDGALFIYSKNAGKVKIFKVNGILYKTVEVQAGWTKITDLDKDVYVVKGRKVIVK